ncbi:hypothetical protein Bbelb_106740 [Branchiostoma belcheri]|nr:hypothetical protein Bbelb_205710 [Branchiostoma belcheri]KAI8503790.1 hypothetical protein Bbelb_187610 [Branchiostoma belcheri]KAI8511574.1 hypothetical protein Bbelb_106740 [Branchiostoma belcheri]
MALVPQELLSTIQAKQQEQMSPLLNTAVGLDAEMRSVLERPDLPDDEKATLYQQLLQRYLTYRDKRRTEPVTVRVLSSSTPTTKTTTDTDVKVSASPTTPSGKEEQNILDAFPKTMKSRAQQILNVIKHKGGDVISYDDQGQLLFNKQVVPGSNVADLIRDALQMRRGFNPVGWQSFARGLASINAPEAAIRHPTRLSVIQRHKSRAAKGEELSDSDDIPTPTPPRRRAPKRLQANKAKVFIAKPVSSTKQTFKESSWK